MILKIVRWVLSQVVLWVDRLTPPQPLQRSPEHQAEVDAACSALALYQFEGCPFCVKVRRQLKRLNLTIEIRDAQRDLTHRETLVREGGMLQVPCLRIIDATGAVQWLYESSDINQWLTERFHSSVRVSP